VEGAARRAILKRRRACPAWNAARLPQPSNRFIGGGTIDEQISVDASARAEEIETEGSDEVAPDLAYQRLALVNVVHYGVPGAGGGGWVLVDAGLGGRPVRSRPRWRPASEAAAARRPS
jgi:hypothetical protein